MQIDICMHVCRYVITVRYWLPGVGSAYDVRNILDFAVYNGYKRDDSC